MTESINVNIGMTNALINIIFPRIVKFRFPQDKNKVFILSILFSQFNFSHSSLLLPQYTPNVFQIKIDEKTHSIKKSQLADDATLFCTSKEEIYLAFNEIETFGS
jgi:hypothetical protein